MSRRLICSSLTAGLLILAFPNFHFSFLVWFGLIPLLYALDQAKPVSAFGTAYFSGLLFFLGTHYWLIHVTLPGMILVNMYLALYWGLFGAFYCVFRKISVSHKIWVLPCLWVVTEFVRDRLLTGFGWACLGHALYKDLPMIQLADLTGVFGISFVIVAVNVALKEMIRFSEGKFKWQWRKSFLAVIGLLIFVIAYGFVRLDQEDDVKGKLYVTVIQPNIPQADRWKNQDMDKIFKDLLSLTASAVGSGAKQQMVIWPESAFPGILGQSSVRDQELINFIKERQISLLLGVVTIKAGDYYNSALLMNSEGKIVGQYDKIHLVPFGEFLPLRPYLNFIENIVPIGDFHKGTHLTVFPGQFSVLICFEDTVAPLVRDMVAQGAEVLVNITNDAWFKNSNAPQLHVQAAVLQAVAHRRALVRAANTGVSALISPVGQILATVRDSSGQSIMVQGAKTLGPLTLKRELSLYTRFGDMFAYGCIFLLAAAIINRKYLL